MWTPETVEMNKNIIVNRIIVNIDNFTETIRFRILIARNPGEIQTNVMTGSEQENIKSQFLQFLYHTTDLNNPHNVLIISVPTDSMTG